jgi:mRNA interferase MazF
LTARPEHGALFLADLNLRRGTEAGKIRPVLVMQTDLLNGIDHPSTWVLPCTTKLVGESLLRVLLPKGMAGNTADCEVMIDQGRTVDNRRITRKLGTLPPTILAEVKEKVRRLGDL